MFFHINIHISEYNSLKTDPKYLQATHSKQNNSLDRELHYKFQKATEGDYLQYEKLRSIDLPHLCFGIYDFKLW